ncbi:MAG: DUF2520 domain-containing protein [Myxococcota bacterium]
MRVAIVGLGRVGTGLANALDDTSLSVERVSGRTGAEIAPADLVILSVSDAVIRDVAGRVRAQIRGAAVVHCAGSRGADELAVLRPTAPVGAFHPLVSFSERGAAPVLRGTTFAFSGDDEAKARCRTLTDALGARLLVADVAGPRYHAAAALVANGAAALVHAGVGIFESLGIDRREGELALGALLRTVADNVTTVGVPRALSGPVKRGDLETVERHRNALPDEGRRAYDAVLPVIVACALDAGLSPELGEALLRLREDG